MNTLLEGALEHAQRGWPVFPCQKRGKRPLTPNGFKNATCDEAQIRAWWHKWPDANVGVPTGASTFDALDIDGEEGEQSLAVLEAAHGDLEPGPRQHTGRGRQLFFMGGSLGQSAKRLPGIDTRGDGGYVIIDPSVHPSGVAYRLEDESEPFPAPPPWLLEALQDAPGATNFEQGPPVDVEDENARLLLEMAGIPLREINDGSRNVQLFKIAASLRARGQEYDSIVSLVRLANHWLCNPPIDDKEVVALCQSAARKEVSGAYRRAEDAIHKRVERDTEEHATEETKRRAATEAPSAETLETLREMLRIPLLGVEQYGRKTPKFYLRIESQPKNLKIRIYNLLSFDEVRRRLFDELGVVVSVKRRNWDATAALLRQVAAYQDPELDDIDAETLHYLSGFLAREKPSVSETKEELHAARMRGDNQIQHGARVYFRFDAFRSYTERAGLKTSLRELWQKLRETEQVQAASGFRVGGKFYNPRYWIADPDA